MIRTLLLAAIVALAAPAFGQSSVTPVSDVDPSLIGDWTLIKVEDVGEMGRFGAELQSMTCAFEADGSAEVRLEVEQDQEVMNRTRAFQFSTEDGQIEGDGVPGMRYQVLGDDLLVLRSGDGLVVHLRRVGEGG